MADQIPIKVLLDDSSNTCGLAQFIAADSVGTSNGGTGLITQGICGFTQPGINAVACKSTYIGICAGKSEGAANENTYVGYGAGQSVTTGCYHTIIGSNAGDAITTCSHSTLIGYNAGTAITFGVSNTAIGSSAGASITTANDNTLVGYAAGIVSTGNNNTGLGSCVLVLNTLGVDNVVIGSLAGKCQVASGCNNTYIGSQAGEVALCRDNTLVGAHAGTAQTSATCNTMLGGCVGYGVVGGAGNVYIGYKSGLVNTSGNDNVFIGKSSGAGTTGSCCLIIGNGTCDLITGSFADGCVVVWGIGVLNGNVGIGTTPSDWSNSTTNLTTGKDLEIWGGSGSPAGIGLGAAETTNGDSVGTIFFANTDNSSAAAATGKVVAGIRAAIVTSDSNAGDDSGGTLSFHTKPEAGSFTEAMTIDSSQNVGIGTAAPDGTLHVHTATAGTVAASSQADDLVVENSAEGGITILTPDAQSARIRFSSPSTNTDVGGASIFYRQNINKMIVGTEVAGGVLSFNSGAGSQTMTLDSSGNVGIGTATPNASLTIEAGVVSIKEVTTPTATANYGKVYTKTDNKLYFQDGAGTEHELAYA